jgi:hypothetical protein
MFCGFVINNRGYRLIKFAAIALYTGITFVTSVTEIPYEY